MDRRIGGRELRACERGEQQVVAAGGLRDRDALAFESGERAQCAALLDDDCLCFRRRRFVRDVRESRMRGLRGLREGRDRVGDVGAEIDGGAQTRRRYQGATVCGMEGFRHCDSAEEGPAVDVDWQRDDAFCVVEVARGRRGAERACSANRRARGSSSVRAA